MAGRWTYSRVIRRIRHIVAADELRSVREVPRSEEDAPASPLLRHLEAAVIVVGGIGILILLVWVLL